MVYNKNTDDKGKNDSNKKSLSFGKNKNEGLIASREEMEKGIERILKDIDRR